MWSNTVNPIRWAGWRRCSECWTGAGEAEVPLAYQLYLCDSLQKKLASMLHCGKVSDPDHDGKLLVCTFDFAYLLNFVDTKMSWRMKSLTLRSWKYRDTQYSCSTKDFWTIFLYTQQYIQILHCELYSYSFKTLYDHWWGLCEISHTRPGLTKDFVILNSLTAAVKMSAS